MVRTSPNTLKVMHVISGDLWAGAEVQAYTLLSQLRHSCELSVILLNEGRLAQELKQIGVAVTVLDENRMGSKDILHELRKMMKIFAPDIVHTHRQKENILGAVANFLSVRAKCVRTSHGAPEFRPRGRQRLQVALNNWVGRYLQDAIIAVSTELAAKLKRNFPAKKVHIIHNGIDAEAVNETAETADFKKAMPNHLHVGIIGRLEPVKRVDIFLNMIPSLLQQQPERQLHFHIIGDGKLREQLESQASKLDLMSHVTFHGHRSDIPSCIRSLDVVVMCSDHEGTPMTALEAMALGTPLVAHDTGGLRDILSEYPLLRVGEHDPKGYARHLNQLIDQLPFRVELGRHYLAETNRQATEQLYRSLL